MLPGVNLYNCFWKSYASSYLCLLLHGTAPFCQDLFCTFVHFLQFSFSFPVFSTVSLDRIPMLFSLFPIDWDPRWNGFAFWVTNSRSREKAVRYLFRYEYQSFQKIRLDNSLELWTQPFLFLDRTSFVSGFCSFVCMSSDGSASGCLSHPSTFVFLLFHQASDSRYPCSLCFARWRYGSLFRILQSLLAYSNAFLFVFAFGFPFSFPYLLLTFRLPDTPLYPNSISALRLSKVDLLSRLPSHGSLEHMLLGSSALPSVRKIRFAYFVRFVPSFLFTR